MKTVKAIIYYYKIDEKKTLPTFTDKVIGIYNSDKIEEGINLLKEYMIKNGKVLKKESKDCCDYSVEYEEEEGFYTESFILNELNL